MASLLNEICSGKRKITEDTATKPPCKYGMNCYRKNPIHLQEFSHPNNSKEEKKDGTSSSNSKKARTSLESCSVQNSFLYSTVKGIDDRYNKQTLAVSIEDILADNCDCLKESVQFNYCFDIPWLVKKYPASVRDKPLLLVHGFTGKEKLGIEGDAMQFKNIDLVHAKLPIPFGTHHTKMMFLLYTTGLKVVIHTANLIEQDWKQKTQGIWISPMFPQKTSSYSDDNDSFKKDLVLYLSAYKSSRLSSWITIIENHDMTTANVHIVASVPGRHAGKLAMNKWGHLRMRQLLTEFGPEKSLVSPDWPVIGQFSSIGSLGEDSSKWLCSEWLRSLSCCKDDKFVHGLAGRTKNVLKLIYPTIENVRHSLEGYSAGGSLPYGVQLAMKQRYLKEHLCQWVATNTGRSLASPHIKTYARVSPDSNSLAWFLLTSANLSKAAWGAYEKDQSQLMIRSYEIGVLFLPERNGGKTPVYSLENNNTAGKYFQLPYDMPLTPYSYTDKPWVWDIKYTTEDSHGRYWIPK